MKKFFATILTLCFFSVSSITARGEELSTTVSIADSIRNGEEISTEISLDGDYTCFNNFVKLVKEYALEYSARNQRVTIAISSLDKHEKIRFQLFRNSDDTYKELIDTIDDRVDFVQIIEIMPNSVLKTAKEAFEDDAKKAVVDYILPLEANAEELTNYLDTNNIPIYWNIEENELGIGTVEVAIGKYEIRQGDTLSEIAELYDTTVLKLMEDNHNIKDPDLIYAGDFLVIK